MFLPEMILKEEILPMLVKACPSFNNKWQEHKQEYNDEEDFLPYIALGDFARHLIELHQQNSISEFEEVFEVIEKLHNEGDGFTRVAATAGLLESLQNIAGANADDFVKYLKPESLKWWNELNKFWDGRVRYLGQTFNK